MQTELPPIIDDSWFASPECDATIRAAERTAARRPAAYAMARTRPFGRQSHRVRAALWTVASWTAWAAVAVLCLSAFALVTA